MSDCDVCNNFSLLQEATCDEKAFRWHLLKSLCYLIETLQEEAEPLPDTIVLPQVVKTAAQVAASYSTYVSIGLIDSTKQLKQIRVVNQLDCDLDFSFDGGLTTIFTVPSNTVYTDEFKLTLASTMSLQMKISSGTAGLGNVRIEGSY